MNTERDGVRAMPRVHVHATCWNEEKILPFFLRHYEPIAERIFIYDDGSTDRSRAILERCDKVTIEPIHCEGASYVEALQNLYNSCWKRSRGDADWVIVCNVDEHFHHPAGLAAYLSACQEAGVTMIPGHGYEMVATRFPPGDVQLSSVIRRGMSYWAHHKTVIFSPDAIDDTHFGVGRHTMKPVGRVAFPDACELRLLHYKYLGYHYLRSRHLELEARRRSGDRRKRYGRHYAVGPLRQWLRYVCLVLFARTVVAAGGVT
jgi:glycosyltransferase involved in cell wall biosynthesis